MLRVNPFQFFSPGIFGAQSPAYAPVDLDTFLSTGDVWQASGNGQQSPQDYLQMMQVQLLAQLLMQLDPMALAQLVMLNMLAGQMGGGGGGACGCNRGNMGGGGFSSRRSLPNGDWSRNAPRGPTPDVGNLPTGRGTAGDFVRNALGQNGKQYIFGAEANPNNPNPGAFDCSELVEHSAARAGVRIPDGANNQRDWCRRNGREISVEQALRTPGALLFRDGHVAISLGDGRTIEARGRRYGVGVFNGSGRFTSGGLVPGMSYG